MSENARTKTQLIAKLAATIVVAGALLAGVLLPWVGGSGLAARNSASLLDALPVELTDKTPSGNSRVLAADGSLITNLFTNNRTPLKPEQISLNVKQALVDIEDSRFYEHNGLDVQGTLRALVTNVAAGEVEEGGSTLTQQLVKQTLLQTAETPEEQQAANEQTVGRKLREARLALALEETYSKDEILTRYLNIVYFGNGAYGIQAAAQKYFSVNAWQLNLAQAATLAGLVQSPTNDDPLANPENAVTRRNQVLERMNDLGHISDQDLAEISAQPVVVVERQDPPNGCIDATMGAFFCAYALQYLDSLGLSLQQLSTGGYTVQTTLRPDMQAAGDQAVLATLPMGDPLAGMYTAIEPATGRLLAMSVNRRHGCGEADCESVVLNAAASKGAGSTYKVFTAAAALEAGLGAGTTISTPGNAYTSRVFRGPSCAAGDRNGTNESGMYCVRNAGNYPSTVDMVGALIRSSNTYFLALEDRLGSIEGPVRMAERMGMTFGGPNQSTADEWIADNRGSFTFGTEATSPLDLANAYATLGASGTRCQPIPVVQVLDRAGAPVTGEDGQPLVPESNCTPESVPAPIANTLNQILIGDVSTPAGTGTRAAVPGHEIAGKTGTSQDRDSVAFVGYTPQYSASVMVFNPKARQDVGGFGGNMPATIWRAAMAPILTAQAAVPFPEADQNLLNSGRPAPSPRSGDTPPDQGGDTDQGGGGGGEGGGGEGGGGEGGGGEGGG